jgi:hypothetical protein
MLLVVEKYFCILTLALPSTLFLSPILCAFFLENWFCSIEEHEFREITPPRKIPSSIAPPLGNSIPSWSGGNAGGHARLIPLFLRPRLPTVVDGLAMATTRPRHLSPSNYDVYFL